jgi:aminoglycoside phosphotransferase (APT) family kinase protein
MDGLDRDRDLDDLALPVARSERADWGFQNRTDLVTLATGERVVVQRYRRRADAEHRLRVMRALAVPAAEAGIPIPRVRDADLGAEPPWVVFDRLPGVPIPAPEAGDLGLDGPRFPDAAAMMGELLARFRRLEAPGLALDGPWADPPRLAAAAATWADRAGALDPPSQAALAALLDGVPGLFAGRPAVLAHGDFAPVNVLVDGGALSGLVDFESVRLADPLFDPAWWAWSVGFAPARALASAWEPFLRGAGVDPDEPGLGERVRALQVLRMLELLGGDRPLDPGVAAPVADRLRATLAPQPGVDRARTGR